MSKNKQGSVDATPVKSFFVDMLTRDIELVDAILDLLDNCVDGILREKKEEAGINPYKGFKAEIKFNENLFSISDNCGGIPWNLREYAFRMGNNNRDRDSDVQTVGIYGIGMKRAIFKIGRQCLISTQNRGDCYEVDITPQWIEEPDNWLLPVSESSQLSEEDGTTIVIGELNNEISGIFIKEQERFTSDLTQKIQTHYAFIISKGFQVEINGTKVEPKFTRLISAKPEVKPDTAIRPYIYQAEIDGVSIFLCVGFTGRIPSQDEVNNEQEEKRYSSEDAGWTILCNDRAVLFCDRTELTGWGEAGVPRYHTQFIAISGIVEFKSNDATKLPTTTTKRGINASSSLYLQVKNRMREGMLLFTNYTNKWKGDAGESQKHIDLGEPYTLEELKKESKNLELKSVRSDNLRGKRYKPELPLPKSKSRSSTRRISYSKSIEEVQIVQDYLFNENSITPSQVGEECFDQILREAQE